MAEVSSQTPSLSEQYLLSNEEKVSKPLEVTKLENGGFVASEEVAAQEESPTSAEESLEAPAAAATESGEAPADAAENSNKETVAAAEESSDTEQEVSGDQEESEETPEIKLETAPADFRFPTTNQTRHCFTRYIEYHRCIAAKGEGAPECDKFSKYYRSLCPGEWIDRWNEQRENGTFPGPL